MSARSRRTLVAIEWVLIALLVFFVVLLPFDLVQAWFAEACPGRASSCYPWGREWAAQFGWSYTSKAHYLVSGVFQVIVLALALLVIMLWLPAGKRIIALVVALGLFAAANTILPPILEAG